MRSLVGTVSIELAFDKRLFSPEAANELSEQIHEVALAITSVYLEARYPDVDWASHSVLMTKPATL